MKEGHQVAPASVPWGGAAARPPAHARPAPAETTGAGDGAEPHVRVDARKLESALLEVRDAVGRTQLLLDFPGIEAARAERQQMISQVDDYLLPRLRQSGAPILIAMVGSTGAGKSTLL